MDHIRPLQFIFSRILLSFYMKRTIWSLKSFQCGSFFYTMLMRKYNKSKSIRIFYTRLRNVLDV